MQWSRASRHFNLIIHKADPANPTVKNDRKFFTTDPHFNPNSLVYPPTDRIFVSHISHTPRYLYDRSSTLCPENQANSYPISGHFCRTQYSPCVTYVLILFPYFEGDRGGSSTGLPKDATLWDFQVFGDEPVAAAPLSEVNEACIPQHCAGFSSFYRHVSVRWGVDRTTCVSRLCANARVLV